MTDQIKIWSRTYAHSNPVNYTDPSGYMSLPDIMAALSVRVYNGMNYSYYVVLLHQTLTTTKSGQIVTGIGIKVVELLFEEDITFEDVAGAFVNGLISGAFNIDWNIDWSTDSNTEGVSNPKLDEIKTLIKNGEVKGKNIISQIDENTQIVFRNDTGVNAHPVKPKGYIDPVDHYNVEIQTKTPAGKWKSKWSYHIVFDKNGNIIDTFD